MVHNSCADNTVTRPSRFARLTLHASPFPSRTRRHHRAVRVPVIYLTMRLLSLFTGYGGLDMAVSAITGAELVGVSDIATGACTVLRRNHPDVPNLGDITTLDTAALPEFDILCDGYPCQPFSTAGNRRGAHDPRHLWPHVARVIAARRPRAVVLENVRGHLSLGFSQVLADLARGGCAPARAAVRHCLAGG